MQYQNLGRYNSSLAAYEESLEIKQKLLRANSTDVELKGSVANSLVGLGRLHRFLGTYLLAIQTSQQGLETHQALGDKVQIATALINLGLSHFEMGGTDRALEAHEIMRLQLKAELVVLFACETARGYIGPGEGVIGLTWAFLNAGAPTVVVS